MIFLINQSQKRTLDETRVFTWRSPLLFIFIHFLFFYTRNGIYAGLDKSKREAEQFCFCHQLRPRSFDTTSQLEKHLVRKYLSAAVSQSVSVYPSRYERPKIIIKHSCLFGATLSASATANRQTQWVSPHPCSDRRRRQSRGKRTARCGTAAPNDLPSVSTDWEKPLPPATLPCHPSHGGWLLSPMSTLLQLWLAVLTSLPPPPPPSVHPPPSETPSPIHHI